MGHHPRRQPGLFARLENRLKPLFGGAQVTPEGTPTTPLKRREAWLCDACGQPIGAHRFDDSDRGRMYCP